MGFGDQTVQKNSLAVYVILKLISFEALCNLSVKAATLLYIYIPPYPNTALIPYTNLLTKVRSIDDKQNKLYL